MTWEEIKAMKAGTELDMLIAVEVLGWVVWHYPKTGDYGLLDPDFSAQLTEHEGLRRASLVDALAAKKRRRPKFRGEYSSNMARAWEVWTHFGENLAFAEALCKALHIRDCSFTTVGTVCLVLRELSPLVICQAGLLTIENKKGE